MTPRTLGMLSGLLACAAFVACETTVTPASSGAGGSAATTNSGGSEGGSSAQGGSNAQGGSGAQAGGQGGTGGEACVPPAAQGNIVSTCGGNSVATTTGTTQCESCTRDAGGHEYTVSCVNDQCECIYDDTVMCTCTNEPTEGCYESCCPSPWGDTPVGTGGFGGGSATGGGMNTTVGNTSSSTSG